MIHGPVTNRLQGIFEEHGIDPVQHQVLITALMRYTYDMMDFAIGQHWDTLKDVTKRRGCVKIFE